MILYSFQPWILGFVFPFHFFRALRRTGRNWTSYRFIAEKFYDALCSKTIFFPSKISDHLTSGRMYIHQIDFEKDVQIEDFLSSVLRKTKNETELRCFTIHTIYSCIRTISLEKQTSLPYFHAVQYAQYLPQVINKVNTRYVNNVYSLNVW